ncbi:MAG TPA: DUF4388 domain-containing protein [Kofleriaceae bacterium]|nr:DUF4388 domain-containing protein [Kofleriaceae bacterium]
MPGLSKVIVLDPDLRASRQVQLGFEREGVPATAVPAGAGAPGVSEIPADDTGLVVVGGVDGEALELVRGARTWLDDHGLDTPIVFAGHGVLRSDAEAAGADEVVLRPAYLRDVVTIGRLLRGVPAAQRAHLAGNLIDVTAVFTLVRAFAALGRSATLTLVRGLRRGEVRFYHGEVTSAQVGMIHGQAALHQLLLWTDARFDYHHEDIVRRQQIPLSHQELFADAERFLEGVRDSSGGLSPSMVLEQDLQRMQSLGKQIPTEVYGVLRMFDGYRVLADVLEDSAYRVFETLRVAQRAVDAGLLRVVARQAPRTTWRAVLAIEEWLIGAEPRDAVLDSGPVAGPADAPARDAGPASRDARSKPGRKPRRNKKKRPAESQPAIRVAEPSSGQSAKEIDWGALVPRIVGAEVGTLSGVVPASHVSGEIVALPPAVATEPREPQPTIVFDETAARATAEPDAERPPVEAAVPTAETAPVAHDLELDDTKPERVGSRARADELSAPAIVQTPRVTIAETSTEAVVVHDRLTVDTSEETTARLTATPVTEILRTAPESAEPAAAPAAAAGTEAPAPGSAEPATGTAAAGPAAMLSDSAQPAAAAAAAAAGNEAAEATVAGNEASASESSKAAALAGPAEPAGSTASAPEAPEAAAAPTAAGTEAAPPESAELAAPAEPAGREASAPEGAGPGDPTPSEIIDEPSDGVVRQHITTADTAPVRRRRAPSDAPEDDRPGDATGEITMPRRRPPVEPRRSEPTILVADLTAIEAEVSEVASGQVTAPISAEARSPGRGPAEPASPHDAVAFSEDEEAFFRAGHDRDDAVIPQQPAESFADLDEGYQPVGFWDRLRRRTFRDLRSRAKRDKPDPK